MIMHVENIVVRITLKLYFFLQCFLSNWIIFTYIS